MRCRNCGEGLTFKRIPFCADCRWMGSKGMAIGGFLVGAVWALLKLAERL